MVKPLSKIEKEFLLADEKKITKDTYPQLFNISNAFFFQFKARPIEPPKPEFIYLPEKYIDCKDNRYTANTVFVSLWNLCWESAQLRYDLFSQSGKIPEDFKWLENHSKSNIYLLPPQGKNNYYAYAPLYHMLPARLQKINNLPLLSGAAWPYNFSDERIDYLLPKRFKEILSYCFAQYIWPILNRGNNISAYSKNDPIKLIAHNLDFWLPFVTKAIEERLKQNTLVPYESIKQRNRIKNIQKTATNDIIVDRPVKGGDIWYGEEEAWDIAKNMVSHANEQCGLYNIIDAIKSNRVEDDFSEQWSYEKEDFERKIYRKRSKYKVNFVELKETDAVIGPDTEIYENLYWEDFMTMLNTKEKRIVVMLKSGHTKLREISKELGYTNHSPVSKALKIIRQKLKIYLE